MLLWSSTATLVYATVEQTGSPLAQCTEKGSSHSIYDTIYNDLAHLHIILFMAHTYFDSRSTQLSIAYQPDTLTQPTTSRLSPHRRHVEPRQLSSSAILHMTKAIEYLQVKLLCPDLATSLSAIFVVLCLGTCAEAVGDLVTANKHRLGLQQLIEARGGIDSLGSFELVKLKCHRFDISLTLKTGRRLLLMPGVSWKAHLVQPGRDSNNRDETTHKIPHTPLHDLCPIPDARLVNIWTDLLGVCRSFNLSLQTGRKVEMLLSSEVLVSVMHRLLSLDGEYETAPIYDGLFDEETGISDDYVSFVSYSLSPSASSPSSSISQPSTASEYSAWSPSSHGSESCHYNKSSTGWHSHARRPQDSPRATLSGRAHSGMTAYAHEHELMRLGMLTFTTTVFFDAHGLDTEYSYLYWKLSQGLPRAISHLTTHSEREAPSPGDAADALNMERDKLLLWVLYIVYIAFSTTMNLSDGRVADVDYVNLMEWLHKTQLHLRAVLGLRSWAKTRDMLRSILWVDKVHDLAGKMFFDWKDSGGAKWQGVFHVEKHTAGVVGC